MTSNPNIGQEQALRECPFCGGRARIWHNTKRNPSTTYVQCDAPLCGTWRPGMGRTKADREADAIAAWNQRSTPTPAYAEGVQGAIKDVHATGSTCALQPDRDLSSPCQQQSNAGRGEDEPVAYRYVHLDYAGRKVSRYGAHPERVNGHDPIETHPLYAHQPAAGDSEAGRLRIALRDIADAEPIPTDAEAFKFCVDVARAPPRRIGGRAMKHHGTDTCVMSAACVGKPADHGLMCEECRAEDLARIEGCDCLACRSDMARIAPCMKEGSRG